MPEIQRHNRKCKSHRRRWYKYANGCNEAYLYRERSNEVNRDSFVACFTYGDQRLLFVLETHRRAPFLMMSVKLGPAAFLLN